MSLHPFIALEGLDGTGKSTQCRLLAEWLRGRGFTVTQCADPGGTPLGEELRSLLLGGRCEMGRAAEAFLFMASRAELVEPSSVRPSPQGRRSFPTVFFSPMSFIRAMPAGWIRKSCGGSDASPPAGWSRT